MKKTVFSAIVATVLLLTACGQPAGPFYVIFRLGFDDLCYVTEVGPGEAVLFREAPERTGYEFGGWFTDPEGTVPSLFGQTVSEDTVLYAGYRRITEVSSPSDFEALGLSLRLPEPFSSAPYQCFVIGELIAQIEFEANGAAFRLRASRRLDWVNLANLRQPFEEIELNISALYPDFEVFATVLTDLNGGRLATWHWGETVFTLYTEASLGDSEISDVVLPVAAWNYPGQENTPA